MPRHTRSKSPTPVQSTSTQVQGSGSGIQLPEDAQAAENRAALQAALGNLAVLAAQPPIRNPASYDLYLTRQRGNASSFEKLRKGACEVVGIIGAAAISFGVSYAVTSALRPKQ